MSALPSSTFDRRGFETLCAGSVELRDEIIRSFLHDAQEARPLLVEAIAASDAERTVDVAHRLRGAALNFGAQPFCDLTLEMEKAGRDGDLAKTAGLLPGCLAALDALMAELATV